MDEKNKLLSDKTLNKALKVLGIILLFFPRYLGGVKT